MSTTVVNTAGPFTIQELTGARRTLRLVGRALPYRPFNLKTKQRVELTWYPGNPEATATILGAAEEPTTINGKWKDKFIAQEIEAASIATGAVQTVLTYPITINDEPVLDVRQAVAELDSMIRSGQLLQVSWDEQTRNGHLTVFDKNWDNYHDLEWSMTFEWISRGEPTVPVVFTTSVSLSDTSGRISQASADLTTAVDSINQPATQALQEALTDVTDNVSSLSTEAKNAVSSPFKQGTTPFNASRRVVSTCTQTINQTELAIATMEGHVNGYYDSVVPLATMGFQRRLDWAAYGRRVITASRKARKTAIEQRAALAKQMESTLLAVYTAREGDDLRTVSEQFYGSPFDWRKLLLFNELTSPQLSAGQIVLVPRAPGQRK